MILVDVGWIESKALSVFGDRAFDAAKFLLCFFSFGQLCPFCKKNLKSGVVVAIDSRSFFSFRGYDSYSQSLF